MNNNKNMNDQFNRMKQLMNYGLTESKKQPYTGVEYTKVAADGKLYGIVREGTKFYIKVSSKKDNVLAENFEYIGGFRNRKDHEYTSFASAQKNFDFKLRSLAEAYSNGKNIVVESWNPDKQEELTVEATDKMKKEISRERQIMENAMSIFNRKPQTAVKPINEVNECGSNPFCEKPDKEFDVKDNVKGAPETGGDAKKANGYKDASTKNTDIKEGKTCEKCGKNPCECDKDEVNEASEKVLGWNREDPNYMDKSHGTEVGDDMPFDGPEARNIDDGDKKVTNSGEEKQGTIHEDTSMIDSEDNQNSPKPGVGEGPSDKTNEPFDAEKGKQIDEAIDDLDGDGGLEDDADLDLGDEAIEGAEDGLEGAEGDLEAADADLEGAENDLDLGGEDAVGGSIEDRITAIEDKLDQILSALGDEQYEDDDLYDDEAGDEGFEDFGDDTEGEDFADEPVDDEPIEDEIVYESKAYRAMKLREAMKRKHINEGGMESFKDAGRVPAGNMNKLDDFGKHPAYQKVVMSLPPKDLQEFPEYYDMNDESVKNDNPYGEKIGDGAPFDIDPETIDNAIAESIQRILKKNRK